MLLKWGICGCGKISGDFSRALLLLPKAEHQIAGAAASSLGRSEAFLENLKLVPKAQPFGSYQELFNCSDIDIVYVGLLNHQHKDAVLAALEAGKHVLCEKPLGLNYKEVQEMVHLARKKNLFLMEGYWSRFFPVYQKIKDEVAARSIGDPKILIASFGYTMHADNKFDAKFGGGCLTATGCYLPMLATYIFQEQPEKISAVGLLNNQGVDDSASVTLIYSGNRMAQLLYSGSADLPCHAYIVGNNGKRIAIPEYMWCPSQVETPSGKFEFPPPKNDELQFFYPNAAGLSYQAQCVHECINNGLTECPKMTLDESLMIVQIMDECRKQLGVRFIQDS